MRVNDPRIDFRNLPVTVMGLGRFGGGLGAVKYLLDRGARVTVTDLRAEDQLADSLKEFDQSKLARLQTGGHRDEDFADAQLVVVNPAVKPTCPWLAKLRSRGLPLTSEMNLFWQHNHGRVIGVTGSNGKSTTTALIAHLLKTAGQRVHLGGNLGVSLLPIVDSIEPTDWVVLELSSFQLADLNRIEASPEIAVVTNFAPNHLDWHADLDDYRSAKQTILRWQKASDSAVLNDEDEDVRQWPVRGRVEFFGSRSRGSSTLPPSPSPPCSSDAGRGEPDTLSQLLDLMPLPGEHNRMNAWAAVLAARAAGVDDAALLEGLRTFRGLPHRMEFVAEVDGRRFYNDSLATTPESAICALKAFSGRVVLLAGGYDKHVDLTAFAYAAAEKCEVIAWMGQTASTLSAAAREWAARKGRATEGWSITHSLAEAFDWAWSHSQPGDVILLSPACASFDWFQNFADRGDQFRMLVTGRVAQ
jgi:UDP-N-acetylmuramoylalanine--D-glutamate ligase